MQKFIFTFLLFLLFVTGYTQSPSVCIQQSSQQICSPFNFTADPCSEVAFVCSPSIPSGYSFTEKFEWYVNGTLVKTSTSTGDPILLWVVKNWPTNVSCNVTYKKSSGELSAPYPSNTFPLAIKPMNFSGITAQQGDPVLGCPGTVSYSIGFISCNGCYTPTPSDFNITWQAPANWVQTSIANSGRNVSFTPDALTGGQLTATITLNCGYTQIKTININRAPVAPTFSAGNPTSACANEVKTFSINPVCSASSYTYTIVGSPGITFAANNQQTFTTLNPLFDIQFTGGSTTVELKVKSTYPNGVSSAETSTTIAAGTPTPGYIGFKLIDPVFGKIQAQIAPVQGADYYRWYKNGSLITVPPAQGTFIQFPIPRVCDVEYDIAVEAVSGCGVSTQSHQNAYVPCDGYYAMSPNPATSAITLSQANNKTVQASGNKSIDEVRIYDQQGNLKKYQKFGKVKTATLNITGLKNGNYFVEIKSGDLTERKQLVINK